MNKSKQKQKSKKNIKTPQQEIQEYRIERFKELGFLPHQANDLAKAKDSKGLLVDRYRIEKVLEQGCSKQLALRIFT